ncbi:hypothetical protein C8J56DRAFT_597465 [Mycena floridula]|nr:hypothetical protein C8J56DRAFT_597465 [Mycena floridula]
MTSKASSPLYDIEDLMKMLELLDRERDLEISFATCLVARLMSQFGELVLHSAHYCSYLTLVFRNFMNFHGQRGARLQCERSVYSDIGGRMRSTFMNICSVLLFCAPD